MLVAERKLRAQGQVGKGGVVNSFDEPAFTASPMSADIESESEPTVKIIGKAGAGAARIRFQAAAHGKQSSWKNTVHIRAGMPERISAIKLPLGSRLVLRFGNRAKHCQASNQCRQNYQYSAKTALRMR